MESVEAVTAGKAAKQKPLRDVVRGLQGKLCGAFVERERVVKGLLLALIARQHVLLLGPPGTAKSALSNALTLSIGGATHFSWLLTRFSTPEELFGPVSLTALKADRFERQPAGKLPEASIAFLDEVFKANSAILNALLTLLNERVWHNGGLVACPLESVVGASNELPESDELAALYDRFVLRFWVEPIKSADLLARMFLAPEVTFEPVITLDQLHAAQREAAAIKVSPDFATLLATIRTELGKQSVLASDRRYRQALSVLRAAAWLEGDSEVTVDQLPVLADVLWSEAGQRPQIVAELAKYEQSDTREAAEVRDAIRALIAALPNGENETRKNMLIRLLSEGRQAETKIGKLIETAKPGRTVEKLREVRNQLIEDLRRPRDEARVRLGLG